MTRPRLYPWVQGLRAAAALAVAFFHIANDATTAGHDPTGWIAAVAHFMPLNAGVDIFFVVSGFVIVHASANLFAAPGGGLHFLRRRLIRIVPLYWVMTTLVLIMLLLQRSAVHAEIGGPGYILASCAFFPWPRPDGMLEPPLGVGWTLNYEMFFYVVVTPFMLLPRAWAVLGTASVLSLLVAVGQVYGFGLAALRFWADPIVLEFVAGMVLALAVAHGLVLPGWLRLTLVTVACVSLHLLADAPPAWRVVSFGLPGLLLVAAAVTGRRPERGGTAMRILIRLGDASYALYLSHPFVMRGFLLLGARFGAPITASGILSTTASGILYVVLSLAAAQLCALAINAGFERKVSAMLKNRRAGAERAEEPARRRRAG
jgi:exopolysaccharide production protein ExoZ